MKTAEQNRTASPFSVGRLHGPEDVAGVLDLARQLPEWFTPSGMTAIACDIHFQICLLCRMSDSNAIAGFCTYFSEQGKVRIGWLGVAPRFHRRGIGRALIESVTTELREKGVREVFVSTLGEVVEYPPYANTRAFYRAVGFHDFKRITNPDNPECPEELILKLGLPDR